MKILVVASLCPRRKSGAVQHDVNAALEVLRKMEHQAALYALCTQNHHDGSDEAPVFVPQSNLIRRFRDMACRGLSLFDGAAHMFEQLAGDVDFQKYVSEWKPEVLIGFCSNSWPVLRFARENGMASVFRSHNFESSFFWESLQAREKLNPFNWLRYAAKYQGEKNAVRFATVIGSLPFAQFDKYKKWTDPMRAKVLTLLFLGKSVRPPHFHPKKDVLDLFYLGANYKVIFHLRGARLLIEKIAPRVLRMAPGKFRFHICGEKLPKELVDKCAGNIIYHGYVPDLEVFLTEMDAGVFPVETGKTMKGKVFESIARAFPVVISPNCLGGYQLEHGEHVLVGSSVKEFVENILSLSDPQKRKTLAEGASAFSGEHFSKEHIISQLEEILALCTK